MKKLLRELEEMVVDAWPAEETHELDGWLLRASGGPTKRGSSVSTLEAGSELELEERIDAVEAWYRARGKAPVFQLGPCVAPKELEQALIARGYQKEGETALSVAEPEVVLQRSRRGEFVVHVDTKLSGSWREVAVDRGRFADEAASFQGFLKRLGTRCRFVSGFLDGQLVATCFAVASEDRLGIYGMLSVPEVRRRGAARAVLHALAESARNEQLRELYLMVELHNEAARALYEQCGFVDAYKYHYRSLRA